MKQRQRIYYTETQKEMMWERWKAGDTLHELGKLFDRPHTSIHTILAATGGIRPPVRHRSRLALTLAEREEISRAVAVGESIHFIASRLDRAASTISRELHRSGGKVCYSAARADEAAWERAHRPKPCNRALAQIAGWLKRTYPKERELQVSYEAIYRTLFVQTRGTLKNELLEHLRRTRGMRRSRHYTKRTSTHGRIVDAVPISERPACVDGRAVPGHREGYLLFGDPLRLVA